MKLTPEFERTADILRQMDDPPARATVESQLAGEVWDVKIMVVTAIA